MACAASKQLYRRAAAAAWQEVQLARWTHVRGNSAFLRPLWTSRRSNHSAGHQSAAEGSSAAQQSAAEGPKLAGAKNSVPPLNSRSIRGSPVSWASLGLLVSTGAGLLAFHDREKRQRIEVMKEGTVAPVSGPSVGKAAIGGPFKLLNHEGKVVTERDFVGNWTVVYFGFTFCPDICPAELIKLAKTVDNVEAKMGVKIVPVFISVDPERDTVDQVRDYLKDYHPRLVGLTGSVNDIRQVARQYRVYYMKTDEEGSDYLVDHSIIMYLMDPNMEFVKFYAKNYDADALTTGIIEEIQKVSKK